MEKQKFQAGTFPGWSLVVYVVLITIAVDAALLLSVAGHLSWTYSLVVAFSAAVLTAGALFTALEVFKSDRPRMSGR